MPGLGLGFVGQPGAILPCDRHGSLSRIAHFVQKSHIGRVTAAQKGAQALTRITTSSTAIDSAIHADIDMPCAADFLSGPSTEEFNLAIATPVPRQVPSPDAPTIL